MKRPASCPLALAILLGAATPGAALHAQTAYTYWSGGGGNSNLSTGTNWQGNIAPTNDGSANVVFDDSHFAAGFIRKFAPILDYNWYFNSLTFAGGSSFTLGGTGTGLNLGSGITQNSTAAQTIAVPTFLTDDQTWSFAANTGALNFTNTSTGGQINNRGYTLTLSAAGTNTLNGAISGTGALVKSGAGTLTLTGASTYTGATTVSAGTLAVGSGGSLGATTVTVNAGATLQITGGGALTGNQNNLLINGTATLASSAAQSRGSVSVGDAAGATGSLTQSAGALSVNPGGFFYLGNGAGSSGTYTLSGSGSSVSAGATYVGYGGTGTVNQTGGSFTTNNHALYLGADAGGNGTYNLSGSGSSLSTGSVLVGRFGAGTVNQTGGSFTTNGNPLYLSANVGSSGTYTLSGGSLSTGVTYVGVSATGTFNQSGGSFTNGGLYLGSNPGSSGTYTLSGGTLTTGRTQVGDGNNVGVFTQTGGTHTAGTLSLTGYSTGSRGTYTLAGGTLNVGQVTSGDDSSSTVGTSTFHFNGGTLQASASSASFFGNLTTADVRTGGAKIDTQAYNVTVAQALLHDPTSGAPATDGGLTKLGSGTLTLTGTNSYTGNTAVNAGRISELNNGNAFSTSTVSIARGAFAELSNTTATPVSQAANTFTGAGILEKTGSGTIAFGGNGGTVTVALAHLGFIDVQAGTLVGSSNYQADYTNNQGSLSIAAGAVFNGVEGNVRVDALTGAGTLLGGYKDAARGLVGSITIGVAGGGGLFAGTIADNTANGGVLSLTKLGANTQTLTGNITYSGNTTVNGGTLSFEGRGTSGSSAATLTVNGTNAAPATLNLRGTGTLNEQLALVGNNGTGIVAQFGGTLNVSGAIFLGSNVGSSGTYTLGGTGILTASQTNVGYAGTGVFNQNGGTFTNANELVLGPVDGSRGTYNLSGGTLTSGSVRGGNGTSTFNFNGGTLQAGASNPVFFGSLTAANVQAGGARVDTNGYDVGLAVNLQHDPASGAATVDGGLTKLGTGTLSVYGTSTYTGGTTLAGGALSLASAGALGTSAALSFAGGTLQYSANNQADYSARFSTAANQAYRIDTNGQEVTFGTGLTSNGGSLTKLGAGTLTLSGASTYTGATTVGAGTLAVAGAGSVTGGNVSVGAGATLAISGAGSVKPGGSGELRVDGTAANPASVTLAGAGSLSAGLTIIGDSGTGTFTQSGGSFTTNTNALFLGSSSGGSGTYTLSDTGSLSTGVVNVGFYGQGSFIQNGGSFTTNGRPLSLGGSGVGVYTLSGGTLTTSTTYAGDSGTGSFTQSGGLHTTGTLILTGNGPNGVGTYALNGGTLNVGQVNGVGAHPTDTGMSTFNFNGGTLQASASSTGFFGSLTRANVQGGGARIDTAGYNVTVAQPLLHDTAGGAPATDGGLTKLGVGTLTLTGNNTYTGNTTVGAGTLAVNGNLAGHGVVTVATAATITGTGSVAGPVNIQAGGAFSPGTGGGGMLTLGDTLTLAGTSTASFTLGGLAAGSGYTQAVVGGQLSLGGATLSLSESLGFTLAVGQVFYLFDNPGTTLTQGTFGNAPAGVYADAAGNRFLVNYAASDPADGTPLVFNDVSVTVLSVVPEPSTWALLGLGAGLLGFVTLRRGLFARASASQPV